MEFKRFVAFFIDIFMGIVFLLPICACLVLLNIEMKRSLLPWLVWGTIFCKDCFGGRSIGKRVLGYQVIDSKTGLIARPLKCMFRNLFYLLGIIDVTAMFYHSKGSRLGDYAVHTQVIIYNKTSEKIQWVEAFFTIACVFTIIVIVNMLLIHYASSLSLFGLIYR